MRRIGIYQLVMGLKEKPANSLLNQADATILKNMNFDEVGALQKRRGPFQVIPPSGGGGAGEGWNGGDDEPPGCVYALADNFDGREEELTTPWAIYKLTGVDTLWTLLDELNTVGTNGPNHTHALHDTPLCSRDHKVWITGDGGFVEDTWVAVIARAEDNDNYYFAVQQQTDNYKVSIYKRVAGVETLLQASDAQSGFGLIMLVVSGTTLTAYLDTVQVATIVDASLTDGYNVGVRLGAWDVGGSITCSADDWGARTI